MAVPGKPRLRFFIFFLIAGVAIGLALDRIWLRQHSPELHPPPSPEVTQTSVPEPEKAHIPVPPAAPSTAPSTAFSPAAALEELRRLGVLDERAVAAIAASWTRRDPQAAWAWMEGLSGRNAEPARSQFISVLAETDPATAISYIALLEPGNARTELLQRVVERWAARDREAALAWLGQLPAGTERDIVAAPLIMQLSRYDLPQAIELLRTIEHPKARGMAVEQIAMAWAQKDPAAAASWVDTLTDPAELAGGRGLVGRQWAMKDTAATANWISTMQPGPSRDRAITGFISWADDYDRPRATGWAAAMSDPKLREDYTQSTFRRWMEQDPAAARAWLETAPVSEALREQLVHIATTGRYLTPPQNR